MVDLLIDWLLGLIEEFSLFGEWLTTPIAVIGLSPLALFSFGGITLIVGFLVVRLVVGG